MKSGCHTALVTPFFEDGVDYEGIEKLVDFQIANGITGILAVGTTGESPVLGWEEHNRTVEKIAEETKGKCFCIAGAGSNNFSEAFEGAMHAVKRGADAILIVDPYYNGPSSLEIRREYIAPIAEAFPEVSVIPYVIPGRTGTQLLPEDIAILNENFKNVNAVKEATCSLDNMKKTRSLCGPDFVIMSGDDPMTFKMMSDPEIKAGGAVSVVADSLKKHMTKMVSLLNRGEIESAARLDAALLPLFSIVTVTTTEKTPYGEVVCKARNPLAMKTAMQILGMPCGSCRRPLGRMTEKGLKKVVEALRSVQNNNPEILKPVSDFFGVDIDERLKNSSILEGLCYKKYQDF